MIERLSGGKIIVRRKGKKYLYNSFREYQMDTPMHEHANLGNIDEWGPKCCVKKSKISQSA